MTKLEIKKEIKRLEDIQERLEWCDSWTCEQHNLYNKCTFEVMKLRKQLKAIEK